MTLYRCPACGCEWKAATPDDLRMDKNGNVYCPCCGSLIAPDELQIVEE
jgi:DNA-directed RNA polymerase subunit RPC12/RpoP